MANEYSIEWTGDQSFRIIFSNLVQYCFITSLYGYNFNWANGPLNCTEITSTSIQWGQRVGLFFAASGSGFGTYSCSGISNVAPSYIEEVFILFGDQSAINTRTADIVNGYAGTQSVSGANNVIQRATWSAIVTRQQSTPLPTPTGLYADNITSDSARIGWTAVENASGYKVEYRQAAGGGADLSLDRGARLKGSVSWKGGA